MPGEKRVYRVRRLRNAGYIAGLAALLLSGCAGAIGGSTPPDTYSLTANAPVDAAGSARGRQILIAEPQALKALDSEQIVIRPTPSSLQYLAKSQWSDRLPKMVQDRLVRAFEDTGRVGGVGRPGEGLAIDYQVVTSVRAFEIDASGADRAVVSISAKILNDRNGVVVASDVFSASAPVRGSDNPAYVRALDAAFDEVSADIVSWTLGRI